MPRGPSPELKSPRLGNNASIAAPPSGDLGHWPQSSRCRMAHEKATFGPHQKAGGRPFRERPPSFIQERPVPRILSSPRGDGGSFLYAATGRPSGLAPGTREQRAPPHCLAPDGVWLCRQPRGSRGGLLPHLFTLTHAGGDFLCHFPSTRDMALASPHFHGRHALRSPEVPPALAGQRPSSRS